MGVNANTDILASAHSCQPDTFWNFLRLGIIIPRARSWGWLLPRARSWSWLLPRAWSWSWLLPWARGWSWLLPWARGWSRLLPWAWSRIRIPLVRARLRAWNWLIVVAWWSDRVTFPKSGPYLETDASSGVYHSVRNYFGGVWRDCNLWISAGVRRH